MRYLPTLIAGVVAVMSLTAMDAKAHDKMHEVTYLVLDGDGRTTVIPTKGRTECLKEMLLILEQKTLRRRGNQVTCIQGVL